MPIFLPWIGLLLLVLPRPNRSLQVLWLLVPLALFYLGTEGLLALLSIIGSGQIDFFAQVIIGLALAMAAIWMSSPTFKGRGRLATFFGILLIAELFGAGSMALRQDWNSGDATIKVLLISETVFCLMVTAALSMTGFSCRRRFDWLRFSSWMLLWTTVSCIAAILVMCVAQSAPSLIEGIVVAVVLSGMTFGLVLPFLILSFANSFYRARLIDLFAMQEVPPPSAPGVPVAPTVPPVIPPSTPATPTTPSGSTETQAH